MGSLIYTPRKDKEFIAPFGPTMGYMKMKEETVITLNSMMSDKLEDYSDNLVGKLSEELKFNEEILKFAEAEFGQFVGSYNAFSEVRNSLGSRQLDVENNNYALQIVSGWFVRQFENEYNPLHNHNGCDISAVIYLKCPDVKDRRNLESKKGKGNNDGNIAFIHSSVGNRNFDVFEKGIMNLEPSPGLLVMFPSYLAHTVYPFIGEGERRSIAFNANYKVGIEHDDGYHEWLGGNETNLKLEYTYWDKTKIKGEIK